MWRRKTKTAHHVRRHNSQYLVPLGSLDRLEMKELRGRLFLYKGNCTLSHNYGAISIAFDDTSPNTKFLLIPGLYEEFSNCDPAKVLVKEGWDWMIHCIGLMELVVWSGILAFYSCGDINVPKHYRLCTEHSYCRYIAQHVNKFVYFIGKEP